MLVEEKEFKTILENAPIIIWVTNPAGECIFINHKWTLLTGLAASESLGSQWFELIHPGDKAAAHLQFMDCVNNKKVFRRTFRYRISGNKYKLFNADASPRYDENGVFQGFIGIMQPFSSLTTAFNIIDKGSEEINKRISSFISIASHDLGEPIRKVLAFSSLLSKPDMGKLSDKGKDYVSRIQSASQRMSSLMNALISYSKVDALSEDYSTVDLNDVLEEIRTKVAEELQKKSGVITYQELGSMETIPTLFQQLIYGLIDNGLKYAKADVPPVITVSASVSTAALFANETGLPPDQLFHHICVSDNGIGFDQKDEPRIFEIFQRLHGKSEFGGGCGVGLALCKKITERLQGHIRAEGRPGHGATFHVYLPLDVPVSERLD